MVNTSPYIAPGKKSLDYLICDAYGIKRSDLGIKTKRRNISEARFVYYTLRVVLTSKTYREIGMEFGHDHSTIVHAVKTCQALYKTNKPFRERLERILSQSLIVPEKSQAIREFLKSNKTSAEFKSQHQEYEQA